LTFPFLFITLNSHTLLPQAPNERQQMMRIGIAQTDITPKKPVWLTGYGNRDHKSEGVYQALRAGALFLQGDAEATLILTADVIGYSPAYAASARMDIAQATGLLPRQIVLTATHTHCAPFFTPWIMPGEIEREYALYLHQKLVAVAVHARDTAIPGQTSFSRGSSTFGVSRRLPDGEGGILFAPDPDGPMDRDLDSLWFQDETGKPIGSLTLFGCHPTSLGGYLIGGDYPGFLCRAIEAETGVPALFSTGCGGNIRPWYKKEGETGFPVPTLAEVETASQEMAGEVFASRQDAIPVSADDLRTATDFHLLPYRELPMAESLAATAAEDENPLQRAWAAAMLEHLNSGALPAACPQEIQILQFSPELRAVFLGGEVLTEIGLCIKDILKPATTLVASYSNGLIAYIPGKETYDLGGYEVEESYPYFLRPAPFVKDIEDRIAATVQNLAHSLE
jgi:neutral ceramidase